MNKYCLVYQAIKKYALLTGVFVSIQGVASECKIDTVEGLLKAVRDRSYTVSSVERVLEAKSHGVSAASALPNPEFEYEYNRADSPEGKVNSNDVFVGIPIELGGKRSARTKAADAERQLKAIELEKITFDEQSELVLKWFRHKENRAALTIYKKALNLFTRYLKTLSSRSLSPSQKIEKKTIEIAIMDISLLQAKKITEQQDILRHISLALNNECGIQAKLFDEDLNLPKSLEIAKVSSDSIKLRELHAQTQLFQSALAIERSNSYPDLLVGPSFGVEQSLLGNQYSAGVRVSIPLPLFNLNRSGRRASEKMLEAQKIVQKSSGRDLDIDLQAFYEKYNSLNAVIRKFPSSKQLLKDFAFTERQFKRGVISSSLLIESQRKYIEFIESQTQLKVEAIETLLAIYKSTNKSPIKLFEEKSL